MEREGQADRIGAYRILKRLATGGTSDVLLARAEGPHGFERTVVLKLLLSQFQNDPNSARTFAREAAASARLSHSAIVRLFDFFSRPDGQLVMVLEFVDGPPLGRLRGMLKTVGKTLEDKPAIYVATRIFDGLAAAHAATDESGMPAPVIHRDVNPTNVLLPWDGQVKITDFGFAKVAGHASDTQIGILKGTYGYMAPEQVTGESVTVRADVYAAAIVLWELLTRRRAFQKGALPEVEALRAMAEPHLTSLDVLRPDLDKNVRQAMARALEPNAAKRTITAEEMVHVLAHAVSPEQGRDQLVKTLSLVRHDPPAVPTSYPPAPGETTEPSLPRPTPRASRMTPSVPLVRTAPFAVDRPGAPKVPQIRPISKSRPNSEDETQPVTSRGAGALPPAEAGEATSDPGTLPPQLQAPGLTLRQAIDEILRDVPTSLPPFFTEPTTRRSLNVVATAEAAPPKPEDALHTMPTSRLDMPSSARTLVAEAPVAAETEPQPSAPEPSSPSLPSPSAQPSSGAPSFGHTLVMGSPKVDAPGTAPMDLPRSSPRLVGMEATPAPQPSVPPAPAPLTMTAAHGSQGTYPSAPPAPVYAPAPPALSAPSPAPVAPPATPARRGLGTVALVGVVVIGLAAGVTGVLGFARSHRAKTFADVSAKAKAPIAPLAPSATSPNTRAAVDRVPTPPPSIAPVVPSATMTAAATPPPSTSIAASAAPPPASAAPSASASSARAGGAGGETGTMRTAGAVAGRRIFVDERVVGQTPDSVSIKCGTHAVRLGSAGHTQSVDVPCGGEITVGDR